MSARTCPLVHTFRVLMRRRLTAIDFSTCLSLQTRMGCLLEVKPDGYASAQGAVHPTPACDFQKPLALGHIQVAYQFNGSVNGVNLLEGDFTARGMRRVRPVVAEPDTNVL